MPKRPIVYAFIDSQNLNLGVKSAGWTLDFRKFRLYLKNKYGVEKAYLFIGQMAGQESLYDRLQNMDYHLIFKPTTEYKIKGKIVVKGNVDAELVLYAAAKVVKEYDIAVIVTGDGDFHCLVEYLKEEDKLLHLMVPNDRYSKLLRSFTKDIVSINPLRQKLEYIPIKKTRSSGRSKP
ncbi:MAG TPA: NYN domain-containing protein [Candidatus Saccharimonadales bacterium]|nr:NYN domain-containing protein [Candidatus Saccharimonadales bacterium]